MNISRIISSLAIALVASVGCDSADEGGSTDDDRTPLSKADAVGSCAATQDDGPVCGGPAPVGNCWCDDSCEDFGDCCVDAFDECGVGEPQPAVSQCFADAHCLPGQSCSGGVCVGAPECGDGTPVHPLCDMAPGCGEGEVAAVFNGCFQCVDAATCEPAEPPPPPENCDDGSTLSPFCDVPPVCAENAELTIQNGCFACVDPQTCEEVDPPPPPEFCDDGTPINPLCDIVPGCPDGSELTVNNGCFVCVDPATCEPVDPLE